MWKSELRQKIKKKQKNTAKIFYNYLTLRHWPIKRFFFRKKNYCDNCEKKINFLLRIFQKIFNATVKNICNIFCNLVSQFFDAIHFYMIRSYMCDSFSYHIIWPLRKILVLQTQTFPPKNIPHWTHKSSSHFSWNI